jgi:hypothetical protein
MLNSTLGQNYYYSKYREKFVVTNNTNVITAEIFAKEFTIAVIQETYKNKKINSTFKMSSPMTTWVRSRMFSCISV